jgi:hypothetical protein
VTDRPVLSDPVLRSMSGCLMHESAIVGCEPCDYLMTQGRAVESAVLRELAQGVDVDIAANNAALDIHPYSPHFEAAREVIAAALTRAIAGELAKASAREALWRRLDELSNRGRLWTDGDVDRVNALRAQLLGAPDGR